MLCESESREEAERVIDGMDLLNIEATRRRSEALRIYHRLLSENARLAAIKPHHPGGKDTGASSRTSARES